MGNIALVGNFHIIAQLGNIAQLRRFRKIAYLGNFCLKKQIDPLMFTFQGDFNLYIAGYPSHMNENLLLYYKSLCHLPN